MCNGGIKMSEESLRQFVNDLLLSKIAFGKLFLTTFSLSAYSLTLQYIAPDFGGPY